MGMGSHGASLKMLGSMKGGERDSHLGVDDSPLKAKIQKAGNGKGMMSESLTSLRPYANRVEVKDAPPVPPVKKESTGMKMGQPIMPWAEVMAQQDREDRERAEKVKAAANAKVKARQEKALPPSQPQLQPSSPQDPSIRTASTTLRARAAPFMRTPSVLSAFGSSNVKTSPSPSSPTSNAPPPVQYRLPALESSPSIVSFRSTTSNDTPTKAIAATKGRGHARQTSHLVPLKSVKKVVEGIEARNKEVEKEMGRKSSSESGSGSRKGSRGHLKSSKGSAKKLDAKVRKELGFKGTLGVHDQEEQEFDEDDEDSDIPDELRIVLSQSDGDTNAHRLDVDIDTLSFVPTASMLDKSTSSTKTALPPSPGLPPTAPLPTPSTQGKLRASPPAPSLLPSLSSPSPSPTQFVSTFLTAPPRLTLAAPSSSSHEADTELISSSESENDTKQSFDFTGELAKLNESGGAHRLSFVEQLEEAFKTPMPARTAGLGLGSFGAFLSVEGLGGQGAADGNMKSEGAEEDGVKNKASYGRLDMAFKFGGRPQEKPARVEEKQASRHPFLSGVALIIPHSSQTTVSHSNSPASQPSPPQTRPPHLAAQTASTPWVSRTNAAAVSPPPSSKKIAPSCAPSSPKPLSSPHLIPAHASFRWNQTRVPRGARGCRMGRYMRMQM